MAFPSYTKIFHTTSYPAITPTRPELSTAGKVVFITGGGSGIGPRITHAFATSGATKIAIIGRTEATLLSTKASVEAEHPGVRVLTFVADILDKAAVTTAFERTKKTFGPIDILIANAAYCPDIQAIATADPDEFFRGFEVNVKGNFIIAQAFLANSSASATMVHVSTAGAHAPIMQVGFSGYTVSKLAAVQVAKYVAYENPHVKVMLVHPGVLPTDMNKKAADSGFVLPFDDGRSPSSLLLVNIANKFV
jgi:NAD(P)-dependent dehydrogenase (short-subunit alcohol dehydrogenase family)